MLEACRRPASEWHDDLVRGRPDSTSDNFVVSPEPGHSDLRTSSWEAVANWLAADQTHGLVVDVADSSP